MGTQPRGGAFIRARHGAAWVTATLAVLLMATPEAPFAHGGEKHSEATMATADPGSVPEEATGIGELEPADHEAGSATHPYPPQGVPRPLAWIGKFHPPLTHFPIALLAAAAVGELLLLRTREEAYRHAVRFCVWGGAVGAALAAALGWLFAGFRVVDDQWLMTAHRWTGTATALWAGALLALQERTWDPSAHSRMPFRVALFAGAGLAGAAGFLGGALIYGLDHYAW